MGKSNSKSQDTASQSAYVSSSKPYSGSTAQSELRNAESSRHSSSTPDDASASAFSSSNANTNTKTGARPKQYRAPSYTSGTSQQSSTTKSGTGYVTPEQKKPLYIASSLASLSKGIDCGINWSNAGSLVSKAVVAIIAADTAYKEKDEERAYILYRRYALMWAHIRESADYKNKPITFDKILGVTNIQKAFDCVEELATSLEIRYQNQAFSSHMTTSRTGSQTPAAGTRNTNGSRVELPQKQTFQAGISYSSSTKNTSSSCSSSNSRKTYSTPPQKSFDTRPTGPTHSLTSSKSRRTDKKQSQADESSDQKQATETDQQQQNSVAEKDVTKGRQAPDSFVTSGFATDSELASGSPHQGALASNSLALCDDLEIANSSLISGGTSPNSRYNNGDRVLTKRSSSQERGVEAEKMSFPTDVPPGNKVKGNTKSQHSNSDVLRGMRDNLMCPIHLGLLQRPKTLPCHHVICEECIAKWYEMKKRLICPYCNSAHPSPSGGIENLPDNFVVNSLVQEIEKMEDQCDVTSDLQSEPVTPTPALPDVDIGSSFLEKMTKTHHDVPGTNIELRLQMCDSDGNCIRSEGASSIEGTLYYPCGSKESISITFRRQKGDFTMSFVPTVCGLYTVEALVSNIHLKGSPMQVIVRPLGTLTNERRDIQGSIKDIVDTGSGLCVTGVDEMMYLKLDISPPVLNTETNTGKVTCSKVQNPVWSAKGQVNPFGIATWNDCCFITDTNCKCVHVYSSDNYRCSFNGNGILQRPTGIVVKRNGWIFVADSMTGKVEVFSPNLFHQNSLRIGQRGRNGELISSPTQLVLNQNQDKLIIVDQSMNCLRVFDLNRNMFVKMIKTKVKKSKASPSDVTVDRHGNIFVSVTIESSNPERPGEDLRHENKGAILMYNSNGFFLGRFGERELYNPRCLCLSHDMLSHVIVVDDEVPSSGNGESDTGKGAECCLKVFRIC